MVFRVQSNAPRVGVDSYRPSDSIHLSLVIYSRENATTFLGKRISHSIAYQYLRCQAKLVDIACSDVGIAPRALGPFPDFSTKLAAVWSRV